MAQITTEAAQACCKSHAAPAQGVLPWPVLAVLAVFVLGIEGGIIYLFLQTRDGRNISELVGLFSGLGSLVWPFVGLGAMLKTAMATRRS
jgi:hypothetical protein